MRILIACVGDKQHGLGHVQRELVLAHALAQRGAAIAFATELNTPGYERILEAGYAPGSSLGLSAYTPDEMLAADILVIDIEHGPSVEELELVKRRYPKVVTVCGHSYHLTNPNAIERLSDLVICQSVFEFPGRPARVLQGLRYVVIDPAYREGIPGYEGPVIICMGGADPHNLTAPALEVIASMGRDAIGIVGPAADGAGIGLNNHVAIAHAPSSLFEYFQGASIFVGALGMVAYEALAAGLPCILTGWSADHVATTVELGRRVGTVNLGLWSEFKAARLRQAIQIVMADKQDWTRASQRCRSLLDGQGAARCAEAICNLI